MAHDLAHRPGVRTRKLSERAGRIAANVAVGMSCGWWMEKHTRHHNNPNHDELDPGCGTGGVDPGQRVGPGATRAEGLHHAKPGEADRCGSPGHVGHRVALAHRGRRAVASEHGLLQVVAPALGITSFMPG
ncbi:fatty acid desaturase [Micromonospora sp. NPDC050495]|uniref:fatty acid desaturase n=1 Tax=Micromonospora sp. NPDC050495 TaxID=3154936 RepID=UPI0033E70FF3